ncbi:MAG: hypothetical protein K9J16_03820 [Melioribacteraceae bacterium]|nr:hypothetical protein [Melioribacteraceae bacterium]MCF8354242.1 hypothetical protein [Melioribacteraceae bacterium]MCF8394806.1 hypothetical protein [Melioribacteraceae bacterium]MCF8417973.1 hypothetical protein [Melioribacteraceae bacterium]
MKKYQLLSVLILLLSLPLLASGGEAAKKSSTLTKEIIEANYLAGLSSDNCGLRNSCAYFLGEMKSEKAVIPLMKMLRTNDNVCARLVAALALIKIGDERGVYLVKRTGELDDDQRLARMCEQFYKAYQFEKSDSPGNQEFRIAAN